MGQPHTPAFDSHRGVGGEAAVLPTEEHPHAILLDETLVEEHLQNTVPEGGCAIRRPDTPIVADDVQLVSSIAGRKRDNNLYYSPLIRSPMECNLPFQGINALLYPQYSE